MQKTNFGLLVNKKAKSRVKGACCNKSILSPCALAALNLIPSLNISYTFNSIQNNLLTNYLGINQPFLGADIASSILIHSSETEKTYLWFFGDTDYGKLIESNNQIYRSISNITRNTIGIWKIFNNNSFSNLEHYIPLYSGQPGQNENTYGFFSPIQPDPNNPTLNYWPINALKIDNKFYVICEKIDGDLNTVGIDILQLIINNVNEPSTWTYNYLSTIPGITNTFTIGNTFVENDGYVYLYGSNTNKYIGFVNRITKNNFIIGNWSELEVYSNSGYKLFNSGAIPKTIFSPLPLTSTIIFNPYIKSWLILSIDIFALGPKVGLFYSNSLEGPWNGPNFIYTIPSEFIIDSDIIYYAPNFHQEFAQNINELYWTYNINSLNFWDQFSDLNLYTPKMVKTTITINNGNICFS
jgi:hypothetical protein